MEESVFGRMLDPVVIRSGPAEIISSGSIISFGGNPIEITLGPNDDRILMKMTFSEEGKPLHVEVDFKSSKTLELTFHKFNNPLGSGSSKPIHVGELLDRKLYFHYRIYHLIGGDRTITYCFYLAEEVKEVKENG